MIISNVRGTTLKKGDLTHHERVETKEITGRHNTLECRGRGFTIVIGTNVIKTHAEAGEVLLRLDRKEFRVSSKISHDEKMVAIHHGTDGCYLCEREIGLLQMHR